MATISQRVSALITRSKNFNVDALAVTEAAIEHVVSDRNWTPLARLIAETDPQVSRIIRALAGKCLGGVTLKSDKTHSTGLRFTLGDNANTTDEMQKLRNLVTNKASIRSNDVTAWLFPKKDAEASTKDADALRKQMQKLAEKHGFTIDLSKVAFVPVAQPMAPAVIEEHQPEVLAEVKVPRKAKVDA